LGGGELVYEVTREVEPRNAGPPVLTGGAVDTDAIDPKRLADDEDVRYRVRADVRVDEGELVATSVVRLEEEGEPVWLTDAEREERFLRHHDPSELGVLHDRIALGAQLVVPATGVDAELLDWADSAAFSEVREVEVQLRDIPVLERPPLRFDPLVAGPSFDEEGAAARADAMAAHREAVGELLDAFIDDVGLPVTGRDERFGALTVELGPTELQGVVERADVLAVTVAPEPILYTNAGAEEQHEFQVAMLIDHGYDGGQASGMVLGANAMRALILDSALEQDHPAIVQRLVSWYFWDGLDWNLAGPLNVGMTQSGGSHGTTVATHLIANGFEDTNFGSGTAYDRSGMAMEAELNYLDRRDVVGPNDGNAGIKDVVIWMIDNVTPDLFQHSLGTLQGVCVQGPSQGTSYLSIQRMNGFYLDDVFVSQAAGNNGTFGSCNVGVPGTAAGAFTAGAVKGNYQPLTDSPIAPYASRGADAHGRNMIKLAASGKRQDWAMDFNNAYFSPGGAGTSWSSPIIGGAALDVKDMMVSHFGSGVANEVGNLYALMLLFGDDEQATDNGGTLVYNKATSGSPEPDERFGFGRLATRSLDSAGLDAPARVAVERFVLADGQQQSVLANPIGTPVINTMVPATVDRLEAVVWWYEPNLECMPLYNGCTPPAEISVELCDGAGTCYDSNTSAPGPRRVIAPNPGGKVWTVYVDGVAISASTDAGYHYGLQERMIHVALMWEDRARDDVDGPDCLDDVDYDCADCCTANPSQCNPTQCP